ncbi:putative monovalent cation/H+ antiporter 1 subunit E [Thermococcus cleftensis]|uniref:Monovalent cation/H+ antiporter 1 subunit E n=1 Tax=Thermococcus cleftensis (strain DSM 27260 / KACC 17922 / CL1) TaxID=163003 RepID=I3ZRR8_THECF|nr:MULTISPECIES: Na+/H+ antiporter subunit E [Thermococcus]AFL94402.1 putative monovalent cation/H+ antiporter 1 subunit E [Thermococcus cleftensis]NJE03248.1 Na+/H+ antiporter subunit E [Thermococcus sp. MV11]
MGEASKISRYLYTVIVLFLIWLAITASLDPQELGFGLLLSLIVAAFTYEIFTTSGLANLHPKRIAYMLAYIPYFLWAMIKANLDVAYRVLHPKRPIRPGIVKCRTVLNSDVGKLSLANSITLTPGTITLDVDGDEYFIHWIWVPEEAMTENEEEHVKVASENITVPFEKFLKVIFG